MVENGMVANKVLDLDELVLQSRFLVAYYLFL